MTAELEARLRVNMDDKTKAYMQNDCIEAADALAKYREALAWINGNVIRYGNNCNHGEIQQRAEAALAVKSQQSYEDDADAHDSDKYRG